MITVSNIPIDSRRCLSRKQQQPPGPVCVAARGKRGKRPPNAFLDNRGFSDQSDEFDTLLHNLAGGSVLRKRKHPAPALNDIDLVFFCAYDEIRDGQQLHEELPLDHLPQDVASRVTAVIKRR